MREKILLIFTVLLTAMLITACGSSDSDAGEVDAAFWDGYIKAENAYAELDDLMTDQTYMPAEDEIVEQADDTIRAVKSVRKEIDEKIGTEDPDSDETHPWDEYRWYLEGYLNWVSAYAEDVKGYVSGDSKDVDAGTLAEDAYNVSLSSSELTDARKVYLKENGASEKDIESAFKDMVSGPIDYDLFTINGAKPTNSDKYDKSKPNPSDLSIYNMIKNGGSIKSVMDDYDMTEDELYDLKEWIESQYQWILKLY